MQLFVRAQIARTITWVYEKGFLLIFVAFILSSSKGYCPIINFSGENVLLTKVFSAIKSQACSNGRIILMYTKKAALNQSVSKVLGQ